MWRWIESIHVGRCYIEISRKYMFLEIQLGSRSKDEPTKSFPNALTLTSHYDHITMTTMYM